jgi:hypothetical protein
MSVRGALRAHSSLRSHVRNGRQAIERRDRGCINAGSRVTESLYLDEALRNQFPQAHRWDYVVSTAAGLFGVEPHSAKTDQISVVMSKQKWALARMREHLLTDRNVQRWFWVASGFVAFHDTGKARRLLNQRGIEFVGRCVTLP